MATTTGQSPTREVFASYLAQHPDASQYRTVITGLQFGGTINAGSTMLTFTDADVTTGTDSVLSLFTQTSTGLQALTFNNTTSVDGATEKVTVTAHGFVTGDGPIRLPLVSGVVVVGLSQTTDYWLIVYDANTISFATSNANAYTGTQVGLTAAAGVTAITAHGFGTGMGPVQLTTTGTLPAGLSLATNYWLVRTTCNTFKFATSAANANVWVGTTYTPTVVDITAAAGGGTHTISGAVPITHTFVDANVNTGTDAVTLTAHGYGTGTGPCRLTAVTGTLPAGLAAATDYWLIRTDANTVKFASSQANAYAGTLVDITAAAGAGTYSLAAPLELVSFRAAATGVTIPISGRLTIGVDSLGYESRILRGELWVARSFTTSATGGNAATLTGNNAKQRTSDPTSGVVDLRIAASLPLVAGTRTLDAQPYQVTLYSEVGTAGGVTAPVQAVLSPGVLLPTSTNGGDNILVLAPNEGFVIVLARDTPLPKNSVFTLTYDFTWIEVPTW